MRLKVGQPVESTSPLLLVDGGLPVGRHVFRLEVVGARERRSRPTEFVVDIVESVPERPITRFPGPIRPIV
ncbi:MAG TPA: hypothetical protein VE422_45810 [Terriglobia bacterium]|nr:hypothetical protein [Terriglobia bacterium]